MCSVVCGVGIVCRWCLCVVPVLCMVFVVYSVGVMCMVHVVWCIAYVVWCMVYVVWCMVYGVWCSVYGVQCMVYCV